MKPNHDEIGVGAMEDLSLRVSVATLVRVLFENPEDGILMLALERKATLFNAEAGQNVEVIAQPFGGAIRILDPRILLDLIGNFHFDSEESRFEQDFRIFIRPADWEEVRGFCLQRLTNSDVPVLEADPSRELAEEFAEALGMQLKPEQSILRPEGIVIEDKPTPTANIRARNQRTVRVYRIFEARILDTSLSQTMVAQSKRVSKQELRHLAFEDARNGGRGRANSILTIPLDVINDVYVARPFHARDLPISFESYQLDPSVAAILKNVDVPRYRRL
jgi:hypothetical protein